MGAKTARVSAPTSSASRRVARARTAMRFEHRGRHAIRGNVFGGVTLRRNMTRCRASGGARMTNSEAAKIVRTVLCRGLTFEQTEQILKAMVPVSAGPGAIVFRENEKGQG